MFLDLASHEIPIDLNSAFGRNAPVVAEIGCGSGYFLKKMAGVHSDTNFVAAEIHSSSVRRTYDRIRRGGLQNVRLYHGDGRFFLQNLLADRTLTGLYINFPDPWPKEKYAKKRLLDVSFFRLAAARLVDTGMLYLTTDHDEYFEWALQQASESGLFETHAQAPPSVVLETRYAQKWRSADRIIHHAEFRKRLHVSVNPTLSRPPMQHSLLEGPLPDLTAFDSIVHTFDDNYVVIKRVLRPLREDTVLFEVHLEEEGLTQDVLLRIRSRGEEGPHVLGVDPFGRPLATKGVAEAVRVLTDWLADRGLTVVDRSY